MTSLQLMWETLKVFLQDQEKDKDAHCHYFFHVVWEVLTRAIRQKKNNKRNPNQEVRSKIVSADDMIYVENLKTPPKTVRIN